jgi:hypothetical protein
VLQVKPLHDAYQATLDAQLTEPMNVFWAECYESSKAAVHRRNRETGDSKQRFQVLPHNASTACVADCSGNSHLIYEVPFPQKLFSPQLLTNADSSSGE